MTMILKRFLSGLLFTCMAGSLTAMTESSAQETPKSAMHKAFNALSYMLPLSLEIENQARPESDALYRKHLAVLQDSVIELDIHAVNRDAEFQSLASSFSYSVNQIGNAYANSRPEESYFLLLDMTQNCVACHSRLPSKDTFPLGQRMLARIDVDAMDERDVAQLYIATRQFSGALDNLDALLSDASINPIDFDLDGTLLDYLTVCIAVLQDFDRARAMLSRFKDRPDTPYYLQRHIEVWENSLDQLEPVVREVPSLDSAQRLFLTARSMSIAPGGRERIVYDLVTASLLRQFLEQYPDAGSADRAEAYYMLGVIELRSLHPKPAVPQMEILLEAAIRSQPNGPYAHQAYSLLEEFSYFNYGNAELPYAEPVARMQELRALIGLE